MSFSAWAAAAATSAAPRAGSSHFQNEIERRPTTAASLYRSCNESREASTSEMSRSTPGRSPTSQATRRIWSSASSSATQTMVGGAGAGIEIPVGVLFPQVIALSRGPQHYILAPARAPALISKVYPGGLGAGAGRWGWGWGGGGP